MTPLELGKGDEYFANIVTSAGIKSKFIYLRLRNISFSQKNKLNGLNLFLMKPLKIQIRKALIL